MQANAFFQNEIRQRKNNFGKAHGINIRKANTEEYIPEKYAPRAHMFIYAVHYM